MAKDTDTRRWWVIEKITRCFVFATTEREAIREAHDWETLDEFRVRGMTDEEIIEHIGEEDGEEEDYD